MQSTLTPKANDDPHDVVVVAPDAVRVAPAARAATPLDTLGIHHPLVHGDALNRKVSHECAGAP